MKDKVRHITSEDGLFYDFFRPPVGECFSYSRFSNHIIAT